MPRIYKPVGPTDNKAAAPVKETKATTPKPSDDGKKKDDGGQ